MLRIGRENLMSLGSDITAAGLAISTLASTWNWRCQQIRGDTENIKLARRCSATLAMLCIAYALKLDVWVLQWGRGLALQSGAYQWRRPLQAALLFGILLSLLLRLRARVPQSRTDKARSAWICACACGVLACMFSLRLVSLHWVDLFLNYRYHGPGLGRWLEWGVILVAGLAALVNAHRRPANQLPASTRNSQYV
jgi:hypothetical protein